MKNQVLLSYHKAITNSPSDFLASDGELADCVNFEVKNQELKPVEMPVVLPFSLEVGEELVYVHNVSTTQKNYIVSYATQLKIFTVNNGVKEYLLTTPVIANIKSVNATGNVVVVYTDEESYYIKYQDGAYKYIGAKILPLEFSVNLEGTLQKSAVFDILFPSDTIGSDAWNTSVADQLLGSMSKNIAEWTSDNGRFVFPFFIRYAFRLFDGSYIYHSTPILLLPNTKVAPLAIVGDNYFSLGNKTIQAQLGAFVSWIKVRKRGGWANASDWDDIITSVDFFVSSPIYLYNQNAKKVTTEQAINLGLGTKSYFIGDYKDVNSIHNLTNELLANTDIDTSLLAYSHMYIERPEAEIYEEILSSSNFYKFASISYKDACSQSMFLLNETDEHVTMYAKGQIGLEVNETLPDDYMTNDTLIPESAFVYNKRLNITNITRKLFGGLKLHSLTPLITDQPSNSLYDITYGKFDVYVYIKSSSGGKDIVVHSGESTIRGAVFGAYLFYPDTDAYKMILIDREQKKYCQFDLAEHPYLNGSYVFMGYDTTPNFIMYDNESDIIKEGATEEVMPNKLFTSELNNVFLFPLEGIYTVGTGRIIGMAAITRAISQGQFGQYPLLLFCSDGNYALSVDNKGYYSSISPIQEDIILGHEKITSLENSVAVITKKGVMITSGGEMSQIAANMDGKVFDKATLSGIETEIEGFSYLIDKSADNEGFLAFLSGARMAYDYSSNRLFIYNSEKTYMYLYNFDNGTTVKVVMPDGERIVTSVLDYPDTILQSNTGNLYSLYEKVDLNTLNEKVYGFAVTRPLNLGDATVLKSVMQLKNLVTKSDKESYVKYIMYGSNDNINFFRVSSRFGKPYKFYRIAIYGYLKPKDSLSGTILTIDTRRTNKLR